MISKLLLLLLLSHFSRVQLCADPVDGSPPGSPVPGILQTRTPEWVAISFSQCMKVKSESEAAQSCWLLATPWTAAYRAPPSIGFSRQEYCSGLPLPSLPPRSNCLFISWLQSLPAVILEPQKWSLPLFPQFPHLFAMKWWDQMPWS